MATEIDPAGVMPRAILSAVDFRGAHALEVGAGDGRLTFQYATVPASVIGIDTKAVDILTASRTAREASCDARFLCASATALPFPGAQFGIVLLASSL